MIDWKIRELLHGSAWPANRRAHRALMFSKSEKYLLAVLRKEAGAHADSLGLSSRAAFDGHRRTYGVGITFRALQTKDNGWRNSLGDILQDPQLRAVPVLENEFQPAVVVNICERKRTAVFDEVQPCSGRHIRECSVAVVGIQNVPLVAAPGRVTANQFVDGHPALFVLVR